MKIFEFEIQEVLSRKIEIEAKTENEAYLKLKEMYEKGEVVLDSSDYINTEIKKIDNE